MSEPGFPDTASILDFTTAAGRPPPAAPAALEPARAAIPTAGGANFGHPLRRVIERLDALLRRLQRISEFSNQPDCLLRFARSRAGGELRLADGCRVAHGADVVDLHLWNEHLFGLPSPRLGLARATVLRRRIDASLRELARRLAHDPSFACVAALRAHTAFVPRRRLRKVLRIARAFGFDTVPAAPAPRCAGGLLTFWEDLLLSALAWTFNPSSLHRNGVLRAHCELWISRRSLLARYCEAAFQPAANSSAEVSPSLVSARPLGTSSRAGRISA